MEAELWTFPSFINLFPEHSFYEKVNFCQKLSCRQELPLSVQNSNFTHKALTYLLALNKLEVTKIAVEFCLVIICLLNILGQMQKTRK